MIVFMLRRKWFLLKKRCQSKLSRRRVLVLLLLSWMDWRRLFGRRTFRGVVVLVFHRPSMRGRSKVRVIIAFFFTIVTRALLRQIVVPKLLMLFVLLKKLQNSRRSPVKVILLMRSRRLFVAVLLSVPSVQRTLLLIERDGTRAR